jgi:hypothetical protein
VDLGGQLFDQIIPSAGAIYNQIRGSLQIKLRLILVFGGPNASYEFIGVLLDCRRHLSRETFAHDYRHPFYLSSVQVD